jgi:hypothetical protein
MRRSTEDREVSADQREEGDQSLDCADELSPLGDAEHDQHDEGPDDASALGEGAQAQRGSDGADPRQREDGAEGQSDGQGGGCSRLADASDVECMRAELSGAKDVCVAQLLELVSCVATVNDSLCRLAKLTSFIPCRSGKARTGGGEAGEGAERRYRAR